MAEIVNSLFGLPSEDLKRQLLQEQQNFATQYANTYNRGSAKRKALLGGMVGNSLANLGAGILGVQDPRLQRATGLESILQATQQELGEQANDPSVFYPQLQRKLAEGGFTREAFEVGQVGQKAKQESILNEAKLAQEKTNLEKAKKDSDTRPEFSKLLSEYESVKDKDPQRAAFLKNRLDVLGTEGKSAISPGQLEAENIIILNDPKANLQQKQQAQSILNSIYSQRNLPRDFERLPDGSVRPIPGGKSDQELKDANIKKFNGVRSKITSLSSVKTAIDDAKKLINDKTTGKLGFVLKNIPGEPANALSSNLLTIGANLAFDKLQDIRDNSPTGGALGNVSNFELESLKSAIANLNQSLDADTLQKNLGIVENLYNNILNAATSDLATYSEKVNNPTSAKSGSFVVGKTYKDKKGNRAVYQQDGTWRDIK